MPAHRPGRSAAELTVACLENEGVTHVFGIPGASAVFVAGLTGPAALVSLGAKFGRRRRR